MLSLTNLMANGPRSLYTGIKLAKFSQKQNHFVWLCKKSIQQRSNIRCRGGFHATRNGIKRNLRLLEKGPYKFKAYKHKRQVDGIKSFKKSKKLGRK
jgi:hypothetical protein